MMEKRTDFIFTLYYPNFLGGYFYYGVKCHEKKQITLVNTERLFWKIGLLPQNQARYIRRKILGTTKFIISREKVKI